ncbi:sodium-extruding oxaloacetate decarboxylase subunit alpha [Methanobrevibacter sp. UBA212]|uniref:sodium-extruding oxaloacetate decarboxylase subunit alpha n=1 Tax=Methanobrevibacter sp. UBA212 TaxID=1915476 RepID=UPI0025F83558|nr:sodium-extruding oxaloacetate decarboxylase subunit alpha [Methanobrevibacter sp. UBA212]
MAKVRFTETALRDAHQSLLATRMRTEDMIPIAEAMDKVGYFSVEAWGGATFDTCIRYINDDPWQRLRDLKAAFNRTPIQMLLRGQNLVGYKHYPDDIVTKFVEKSYENGVDVFRIFDALNDIRNMEKAIKVAKDQGAHVQGTISYTISPVHSLDNFVELAKELEALDCDSVSIKDMAGLITPSAASELVTKLKDETDLLVDLHCHCTSGMTPISYYAACQAGVDVLDTAISPLAWGTSQPPTESMVAALQGTEFDTELDLKLLTSIKEYFDQLKTKYGGLIDPISESVDTDVLLYQIPGGMLSNLISQLKEQNAMDRYTDVLEEMPRVRKDMGYPPLVTPTSQIVGIQSVMNVLGGERYKNVSNEVKEYMKGMYGKSPAPVDPEIFEKVIGDEEVITCRPADLLEDEFEKFKSEGEEAGFVKSDEDALTYALYPQIAPKFLKGDLEPEPIPGTRGGSVEVVVAKEIPNEYDVEVDGDIFNVKILPTGIDIGPKEEKNDCKDKEGAVLSSMQGMVIRLTVEVGDEVKAGDTICVVEAMKMENDVQSEVDGVVEEIFVSDGDELKKDDCIMVIK